MMKNLITCSILLMAMLLPESALAYDFMVNGIAYNRIGNEATVTRGGNYSGNVNIPETVTYNDTTYTVTTIDTEAFRRNTSLKGISIPTSITTIGQYAFNLCINVTQLVWNARNCPSTGCLPVENITQLTIGEEVETLPDYFMSGISSSSHITGSKIKSLHIPASVTSIGFRSFAGCKELETITVDKQNKKYDSRENCSAIIEKAGLTIGRLVVGCKNSTIPGTIGFIGDYAFYGSGLVSIDIPNTVTAIGKSAFYGCSALVSITLPEGITAINEHTFQDCNSLLHLSIPSGVTSISIYAFNGCTSLTSIDIPGSVTSIGMYAFANCKSLTSVMLPNTISTIDERTFCSCI